MTVAFSKSSVSGIKVLIVSSDQETLDGTFDYLKRVGAFPRSASELTNVVGRAASAEAVIFFADDFATDRAIAVLGELRRRFVSTGTIVVSDQVDHFASNRGTSVEGPVMVLRRPTWGWMLLDAIRLQLRPGPELEREP